MTSFGIVVLVGTGVALYLCTPKADTAALAPGRAIGMGVAGAIAVFVLMLVVTLGTTLAGLSDVAKQRRSGDRDGPISMPGWMKATVQLRMVLVYLIYGCLGFAFGGTVAGTLRLLHGTQ